MIKWYAVDVIDDEGHDFQEVCTDLAALTNYLEVSADDLSIARIVAHEPDAFARLAINELDWVAL